MHTQSIHIVSRVKIHVDRSRKKTDCCIVSILISARDNYRKHAPEEEPKDVARILLFVEPEDIDGLIDVTTVPAPETVQTVQMPDALSYLEKLLAAYHNTECRCHHYHQLRAALQAWRDGWAAQVDLQANHQEAEALERDRLKELN